MRTIILSALVLLCFSVYADPRVRPDNWAPPIINTTLENLHIVDNGVYRSAQPEAEDISDLQSLKIREILNLRQLHDDDHLSETGISLREVEMNPLTVAEEQIVEALRRIKNRKGPILVHCWHGSDRTGVTIAAYRIVFNNWSKTQALDEMMNGGYGYHSSLFPNLESLVMQLDIQRVRKKLETSN